MSVNDSTERPDGKRFHITHSISEGRKPVETNNYMSKIKLVSPFSIDVEPQTFQ